MCFNPFNASTLCIQIFISHAFPAVHTNNLSKAHIPCKAPYITIHTWNLHTHGIPPPTPTGPVLFINSCIASCKIASVDGVCILVDFEGEGAPAPDLPAYLSSHFAHIHLGNAAFKHPNKLCAKVPVAVQVYTPDNSAFVANLDTLVMEISEPCDQTVSRAAKRQRTNSPELVGAESLALGPAGRASKSSLGRLSSVAAAAVLIAAPTARPEEQQHIGSSGLIDRTEFLRLLQQSLHVLGFDEVASRLEAESGIPCEVEAMTSLQAAVLSGDWDSACACLQRLTLDPATHSVAIFLLLEHKYLEALHQGDTSAALRCLRGELCPLAQGANLDRRLHELAACLLCASPRELERHSAWACCSSGSSSSSIASGAAAEVADLSASGPEQSAAEHSGPDEDARCNCACSTGAGSEARCALRRRALGRLRQVLPPSLLLPPRRLEALVEQALQWQLGRCTLHNSPGVAPTLLADYSCGLEQLPTVTTQVLREHSDEVWHVAFSPCGTLLASASKDGTVVVYDVGGRGAVAPRHVLRGHAGAVAFLCWSPEGKLLASCGQDGSVRLWDAVAGGCRACLRHHSDAVTTVAWMPDCHALVTGGHDKQMCLVDVMGNVVRRWLNLRIQDLLVAKGGRYILATTTERRVRIFDIEGDIWVDPGLQERDTIISMSLSQDSRFLLVHLTSQELHLWDMGAGPTLRLPSLPCAAYRHGPAGKHSRYVVRACLGGLQQKFVLVGSEEAKVYMFQRHTGELLASLEGHTGTVNAVSWNPTDPHMFASASDDRTVRIWGLEASVTDATAGSSGEREQPLQIQ